MEMFYLVLAFVNRELSMTTIPQPYSKEQCENLKDTWSKTSNSAKAFCIPVPNDSEYFNCSTLIPSPDGRTATAAKVHCDLRTGK